MLSIVLFMMCYSFTIALFSLENVASGDCIIQKHLVLQFQNDIYVVFIGTRSVRIKAIALLSLSSLIKRLISSNHAYRFAIALLSLENVAPGDCLIQKPLVCVCPKRYLCRLHWKTQRQNEFYRFVIAFILNQNAMPTSYESYG